MLEITQKITILLYFEGDLMGVCGAGARVVCVR